jgi:hypothetical protein
VKRSLHVTLQHIETLLFSIVKADQYCNDACTLFVDAITLDVIPMVHQVVG